VGSSQHIGSRDVSSQSAGAGRQYFSRIQRLGTYLAILAGAFIIGNESIQEYAQQVGYPSLPWRIGFALGVVPSFLIIWIRRSMKEPESWEHAQQAAKEDSSQKMGTIWDLFLPQYSKSTYIGVSLAAIGLATFWGVHIYGKNVFLNAVKADYVVEHFQGQVDISTDETKAYFETISAKLKNGRCWACSWRQRVEDSGCWPLDRFVNGSDDGARFFCLMSVAYSVP